VVLEPHGKKWDVILEIHPHIRNPVFPGLAATDLSQLVSTISVSWK